MPKEGLVDPVTKGSKALEIILEDEAKTLSIDSLTLEDFQPVPVTAATQPHPFEGYPQRKIKIGTYKDKGKDVDLIVNSTWIVALNPKEYVHQDPSGLGISINVGGKETTVDYLTSHNRIVRDERGQSLNIVFDREIILPGGQKMTRVGLCPDHTARAQIVFTVDKKTGKINVDRRYLLADAGQVSRLRRVFEMFNYQQTKSERLAAKFDQEAESKAE